MDALAITVIAGIPNFAGFIFLAVSNNRIITRLFTSLDVYSQRIGHIELRVALLESSARNELSKS